MKPKVYYHIEKECENGFEPLTYREKREGDGDIFLSESEEEAEGVAEMYSDMTGHSARVVKVIEREDVIIESKDIRWGS